VAFDVRSANLLQLGVANADDLFGALPLCRTVTFLAFRIVAINLHELCEVDVIRERVNHGGQVHLVAIRGQLDTIRQAARDILKEVRRTPGVPPSYQPANHEFGIGFDGYERPHVATDAGFQFLYRYLLLLAANETPYFIDLNALSRNVADIAVLIGGRKPYRLPPATGGLFRALVPTGEPPRLLRSPLTESTSPFVRLQVGAVGRAVDQVT
jgi:hypothetical protein